jgi:hypothetical protein
MKRIYSQDFVNAKEWEKAFMSIEQNLEYLCITLFHINTCMCELGFCPLSIPHTTLKRGRGRREYAEVMVRQEIHFLCFTVSMTGKVGMYVSMVHWSWCSR